MTQIAYLYLCNANAAGMTELSPTGSLGRLKVSSVSFGYFQSSLCLFMEHPICPSPCKECVVLLLLLAFEGSWTRWSQTGLLYSL